MEAKKVICPNCGAAIYESEANCPFCGYINLPGAEEKFMRDIKKTEHDMSHIPDLQKEEYKKSMSKSSKIIFITIGITALIVMIILGLYFLYEKVMYSYGVQDAKAQMLWNNKNYPILDAMYEEGDYAGIVEFEYELWDQNAENKTNYNIYDWEHYEFIRGYRYYMEVEGYIADLDAGKDIFKYGKENLVHYCIWFYCREYDNDKLFLTYSDEEKEMLDDYREITNGYLFGRLGFTQEEVDELLRDARDEYGFLKLKELWEYGRKVGDRFK